MLLMKALKRCEVVALTYMAMLLTRMLRKNKRRRTRVTVLESATTLVKALIKTTSVTTRAATVVATVVVAEAAAVQKDMKGQETRGAMMTDINKKAEINLKKEKYRILLMTNVASTINVGIVQRKVILGTFRDIMKKNRTGVIKSLGYEHHQNHLILDRTHTRNILGELQESSLVLH